jgi:hypothetical protein
MKNIMSILACIGLGLTAFPSILVFTGTIDLLLHKQLMISGTILWFIAAPIWFRKAREESKG